jgi:hypothetical protein
VSVFETATTISRSVVMMLVGEGAMAGISRTRSVLVFVLSPLDACYHDEVIAQMKRLEGKQGMIIIWQIICNQSLYGGAM